MSKRAQENIVAFLFLFFFVAMIIISFDYGPRARLVPVPIAAVSAIIMLLQIYLMNFRKDIELNVDAAEILTRGHSSGAMPINIKIIPVTVKIFDNPCNDASNNLASPFKFSIRCHLIYYLRTSGL